MNQFLFHKLRKVDNIAVLDQPRDMLKVMDRAETDFAGNKKGSRSPIYEPRFQDFKISRFQDVNCELRFQICESKDAAGSSCTGLITKAFTKVPFEHF